MKLQFTIVGLGQIGASIGMALAKKSDLIERIGYDINPQVMRKAPKIGAVDKTSSNLRKVLQTSDVLLLALPTDEMHPMMEELLPLMKPGAIFLDTALSKEMVTAWAEKLLPDNIDLSIVCYRSKFGVRDSLIYKSMTNIFIRWDF